MQNLVTALPPAATTRSPRGIEPGTAQTDGRRFGQALAQALEPDAAAVQQAAHDQPGQVIVRRGDTLTRLVKAEFRQQGVAVSEGHAWRMAVQLARHNGIANPDRIEPGQSLNMQKVRHTVTQLASLSAGEHVVGALPGTSPVPASASAGPALSARIAVRSAAASVQSQTAQTPLPPQAVAGPDAVTAAARPSGQDHPVLERTLARAVDKGFVPAQQLPAVRQRVLALAERYNFAPDDFARLTLMESGGMNPQASNGRCHGIIQFCEGAQRGAAAVGLQNNPRSILGMGLLQQLELVDRYFANVGLSAGGPRLQLDDLYLAVLTPAARSELRRDAPLDIAGPQASLLHVNRDRRAPITRNSILEGLHALTEQVLFSARRPAARLYAEVAAQNRLTP